MKNLLFITALSLLALKAQAQNVGIGTTTPLQKLHVEGTTYLNGNVGIGTTNPNAPLGFPAVLGKKLHFILAEPVMLDWQCRETCCSYMQIILMPILLLDMTRQGR